MFSPDRDPHPAVAECKYLQQHVKFTLPPNAESIRIKAERDSLDPILLHVQNRYVFRDLSHLSWTWSIISDVSVDEVSSGKFSVAADSFPQVLPLNVSSALSSIRKLKASSYWLNITGALSQATTWAEAGHVLVQEQFSLQVVLDDESLSPNDDVKVKKDHGRLDVSTSNDEITISRIVGGKKVPFVVICKSSGAIKSLATPHLGEVFASNSPGLIPNYTRAATDNDRGGIELLLDFVLPAWVGRVVGAVRGFDNFSYHYRWNMFGLSQSNPPLIICRQINVAEKESRVVVKAEVAILSSDSSKRQVLLHSFVYEIHPDGRVLVTNYVTPSRDLLKMPSLPRVGLTCALNPLLFNVMYYGKGPHENYPDRKASTQMSVWKTTAKEMSYPHYVVPGETGSRSDCEWVAFQDDDGNGICVVSDGPARPEIKGVRSNFSCSAILHSATELHGALHTYDLPVRENGEHFIYVNLDHKIMGLGGDVR